MALSQTKKNEVIPAPPWHPNLRIVEGLPDTKVVRTAFFVNGAAMLVVIALALYLGIQEWKLHEVNKQIADWQRQIERDTKQSADAVALYQDFKLQEAKTKEVADFMASKPILSAIILRLAQVTPKKVAMDIIDFKETGVSIRATVKGAPDRASGDASAYEKQLRTDKVLGPMFGEVNLLSMNRNTATGRLVIEIFCEYKGAKKS
jgi:Tfp pilus assembly protein PilN